MKLFRRNGVHVDSIACLGNLELPFLEIVLEQGLQGKIPVQIAAHLIRKHLGVSLINPFGFYKIHFWSKMDQDFSFCCKPVHF